MAATILGKRQFESIDDSEMLAYQALGSVIKGQSVGFGLTNVPAGNIYSMVDGQARYSAIYLRKAATLTGVKVYMATAGTYTADQNNYVALYSYSGGTMTRVAISTNNGNVWKSSGLLTIAFSGTYAAAAGIYFVGVLYNTSAQTTAPVMFVGPYPNNTVAETIDFTNSAMLHGTIDAQNTLPTTQAMSGLSANNNRFWAAVY